MITKETVVNFRKDFAEAVKDLAKKYDAEIDLGSIGFNDLNFHTKMTVTLKTKEATELSIKKQEKQISNFAFLFNINDLALNAKFKSRDGKIFIITSICTKKSKYPIIAEFAGKSYKISVDQLRSMTFIK
jgi:hypothetical protein